MRFWDLHNHSTFCDGKNTPEEMTKAAISSGFCAIGFSSHSYTPFDTTLDCLNYTTISSYILEIKRIKEIYKDKIKIYVGIEQDYYSPVFKETFDYIIGSVHYTKKGDNYICVDYTPEALKEGINKFYNGNSLLFLKEYYACEKDIINQTHCNFIGHFDIITKFNDTLHIFDEESKEYQSIALEAACELCNQNAIFEVNSGCMNKKYKSTPYPSPFIMKYLKSRGCSVIISGDNHNANTIKKNFMLSYDYATSFGISLKKIENNNKLF